MLFAGLLCVPTLHSTLLTYGQRSHLNGSCKTIKRGAVTGALGPPVKRTNIAGLCQWWLSDLVVSILAHGSQLLVDYIN